MLHVQRLRGAGLYQEVGLSLAAAFSGQTFEKGHCAACAYCKIWVLAHAGTHWKLRDNMFCNKEKGTTSSKGLALVRDGFQSCSSSPHGPLHTLPVCCLCRSSLRQFSRGRPSRESQRHLRSEAQQPALFLGTMKDFCCHAIRPVLLSGLWGDMGHVGRDHCSRRSPCQIVDVSSLLVGFTAKH